MNPQDRIPRLFDPTDARPQPAEFKYDGWSRIIQGVPYGDDDAAGLYGLRYRSYSPLPGRWVEADPVEYVEGENR